VCNQPSQKDLRAKPVATVNLTKYAASRLQRRHSRFGNFEEKGGGFLQKGAQPKFSCLVLPVHTNPRVRDLSRLTKNCFHRCLQTIENLIYEKINLPNELLVFVVDFLVPNVQIPRVLYWFERNFSWDRSVS
jgi:hypothetical protein